MCSTERVDWTDALCDIVWMVTKEKLARAYPKLQFITVKNSDKAVVFVSDDEYETAEQVVLGIDLIKEHPIEDMLSIIQGRIEDVARLYVTRL